MWKRIKEIPSAVLVFLVMGIILNIAYSNDVLRLLTIIVSVALLYRWRSWGARKSGDTR